MIVQIDIFHEFKNRFWFAHVIRVLHSFQNMVGLDASYKRVGAQMDTLGFDSDPSIPSDRIEQGLP